MRVYQFIMEDGPDIVATISPDVHCNILYINEAAQRILHIDPKALTGTPFWNLIHTGDRSALADILSGTILIRAVEPGVMLPCRVASFYPGVFVDVDMTFAYGRQGILCVLRKRDPLPTILGGSSSAGN